MLRIAANLTALKTKRTLIVRNIPIVSGMIHLIGQPYIAILLASLVMFCPFQCYLGTAGGDEAKVSCCGHCSGAPETPLETPVDSTPHAPSECPCHDCFCCGALPIDKVEDGSEFVVLKTVVDLVSVKLADFASARPVLNGRSSFSLPPDLSGRTASVVFSCWLL